MPKLTVLMPNYNKAEFISAAINSVLSQKTDFEFLLLIIDDKSTDGSLLIARDFQRRFPKRIALIENERNFGCLHTTLKGYSLLTSAYFCVLDPDDYWIEDSKLQQAVEFLDHHPDFTMYIANTYIENDGVRTPFISQAVARDFSFDSIKDAPLGHTSGVVFRNSVLNQSMLEELQKKIGTNSEKSFEGDSFRNLVHLKAGKARFVPRYESVYRITGDGIWTKYGITTQNYFNARFYLDLFFFLGAPNPIFFLNEVERYLFAALGSYFKKLDEGSAPDSNFEGLNSLLIEFQRTRNQLGRGDLVSNISFVFFLPSRVVGGYEFLFTRLARQLVSVFGFRVFYIDYEDGFSSKYLSDSGVEIINFLDAKPSLRLSGTSVLIAPITMARESPNIKADVSKNIFWAAHPKSIEWLQYRSKLPLKKVVKIVRDLASARAICFMDWACWTGVMSATNINFEKIYMPVFAPEKLNNRFGDSANLVDSSRINVGWLGRLDSDKIYSLINLLDQASRLAGERPVSVHVIGSGNAQHLIELEKYTSRIEIKLLGTITGSSLDDYLVRNVDVVFAMGISSLEAAALRIPSVLVFLDEKRFDLNQFVWLFESKSFSLGFYLNQKPDANLTSFEEVIEEIYEDGRKGALGARCFEYFQRNHQVDKTLARLLMFTYEALPSSSRKARALKTLQKISTPAGFLKFVRAMGSRFMRFWNTLLP